MVLFFFLDWGLLVWFLSSSLTPHSGHRVGSCASALMGERGACIGQVAQGHTQIAGWAQGQIHNWWAGLGFEPLPASSLCQVSLTSLFTVIRMVLLPCDGHSVSLWWSTFCVCPSPGYLQSMIMTVDKGATSCFS